jgi:hypothetical protein
MNLLDGYSFRMFKIIEATACDSVVVTLDHSMKLTYRLIGTIKQLCYLLDIFLFSFCTTLETDDEMNGCL